MCVPRYFLILFQVDWLCQENGTAVSSVASRFLYGLKDGHGVSMSDNEVNVVFEVLANPYIGEFILLLPSDDLLNLNMNF